METDYELEIRFSYHPPIDEEQRSKYEDIRSFAHELALLIHELVPASREQSLAVTKLEEAVMWANAGIARRSV
jgi:hypothetical protein